MFAYICIARVQTTPNAEPQTTVAVSSIISFTFQVACFQACLESFPGCLLYFCAFVRSACAEQVHPDPVGRSLAHVLHAKWVSGGSLGTSESVLGGPFYLRT